MKALSNIQQALTKLGLDAWLLLDFRGNNSIAHEIVEMPSTMHCTRRWAVLIPAKGRVQTLVHAIEDFTLAHLDANHTIYAGHAGWQNGLQSFINAHPNIAIEYSPMNAIPTASKVDAGTVELLRGMHAEIHSSADLLQMIAAVWSDEQLHENLEFTAPTLGTIMQETFQEIRSTILNKGFANEYTIQQFVMKRFKDCGLKTYSEPIIARDINAASPHYAPSKDQSSEFGPDTVVLIDMWACPQHGNGTYSDITWMCHTGNAMDHEETSIFTAIIQARNAGISLFEEQFNQKKSVRGCDIDDAVRTVIRNAGYGDYFVHRTGHSITTETHGSGANMDNYETEDTRIVIPMTSCSIEPGIYIPGKVGMRTEIDMVFMKDGTPIVSGLAPQQEMIYLG
ncbi:MAG: M24 family metallopeptidase [Bacteroidetes bacterium]|nr:M24 family metallopeptidase [Bacteroidota bacterium]